MSSMISPICFLISARKPCTRLTVNHILLYPQASAKSSSYVYLHHAHADEMAISAVTLAELSAGPHQVRPNGEQDLYDEHEERARRTEALQRAESEFDPVPFDVEAARVYGRVTAAVVAAGRKPRRRNADLMIAATAISEGLPLYTTNPGDYAGLEKLVRVIPVTRPPLPREKRPDRG